MGNYHPVDKEAFTVKKLTSQLPFRSWMPLSSVEKDCVIPGKSRVYLEDKDVVRSFCHRATPLHMISLLVISRSEVIQVRHPHHPRLELSIMRSNLEGLDIHPEGLSRVLIMNPVNLECYQSPLGVIYPSIMFLNLDIQNKKSM